MDKQYDVFISYGRKDYEIEYQENGNTVKKLIPNNPILQIVEALNEAGISCWYDQNGVSTDFLKYIKQKIDSSRVMIFVSSQYSNQSVYTADEIARALQLRMPIVPFKIDKTEFNEDFALGLASKNTIDIFMTNPKKALADLVICVQKSLQQVHKKEAEKLRKKQEEERRAEKERQIMEQEQRRRAELYEYKARLQDVQTRLLKTRNQCEELELEERKLKEAIKRLETPTPQPIPRKYYYILIAICLFIIITALLWIFIPRESKLTVSTHEIACSDRDTSVCISVFSNKHWIIEPLQGAIFSAAHENDTTMRINIHANLDSVARMEYITVLTKDRKKRETISLHQERTRVIVQFLSIPRVEIVVKSNGVEDQISDVYIHAELYTKYLKDVPCYLMACKSNGKEMACTTITPLYDETQNDYTLFIPYKKLSIRDEQAQLYVIDKASGKKLASSPFVRLSQTIHHEPQRPNESAHPDEPARPAEPTRGADW